VKRDCSAEFSGSVKGNPRRRFNPTICPPVAHQSPPGWGALVRIAFTPLVGAESKGEIRRTLSESFYDDTAAGEEPLRLGHANGGTELQRRSITLVYVY
jgi:hypothetical protein